MPHLARRVRQPNVLWHDPMLEGIAREFAYASPLPGETDLAVEGPEIPLLADRYGGRGIAANGGSGRCVSIGDVQIKGVGRTALADHLTPESHAYGGMTLLEGVRELLWATFLKSRLTYGVVDTLGLLETGSTMSVPQPGGTAKQERRALLLRRAPLRLAHFMAATDFHTGPGMALEHLRMDCVIAAFPEALRLIYGDGAARQTGSQVDLTEGLLQLLDRLSSQIAQTYALRVMHGGLSPSNVCLDGKLLDFGMTTSVSGHVRMIVSGRSPDMLEQQQRLYWGVEPLFFYLEKFGRNFLVPSPQALQQHFHAAYDRHLAQAIESALELPEGVRRAAPPEALARFIQAALRVSQPAPGDPFKLYSACPEHESQMPSIVGTNLDRALFLLYSLQDGAALDTRCAPCIPDSSQRRELIDAYFNLKRGLAAQVPSEALDWTGAASAITHRVRALEMLAAPGLNRRITAAQQAGDLQTWLEETLPQLAPWAGQELPPLDDLPPVSFKRYSNFNVDGRGHNAAPSEHEVVGLVAELHSRVGPMFERDMLHLENVVRAAFRRDRLMLFFSEDRDLVGYAAVATVGTRTLGRLQATRRAQLHPSEWIEGHLPFVVDVVCMPGRMRFIARRARMLLRDRNYPSIHFLRRRGGQLRWREWQASPATCRSPTCRCGRSLDECTMRQG